MVNQAVLVTEIVSVVIPNLTVRVNVQKDTQVRRVKNSTVKRSSSGSRPMKGRTFADHQK